MTEREGMEAEAIEAEVQAAEAPAPEQEAPESDREAIEAEAAKFGWKPKEQWKGDTSNWTDAAEYLEYARSAPVGVKRLQERLDAKEREFAERIDRMERFNQQAIENARKQALETAREEMRQAAEIGDVSAYKAAEAKLDHAMTEPKQAEPALDADVSAWLDQNPTLRDPAMGALLSQLGDEAVLSGAKSAKEQIAHAEKRLRAMGILREPEKSKPPIQAVDGGGLAGGPVKAARGWSDIPAEERSLIRRQIEQGIFKDEKAAAKAYWQEYS